MEIRDFKDDDYPELIRLANAANPEHLMSEAELRETDAKRDAKYNFARYLATESGQLVGVGLRVNPEWSFHPQRFTLNLTVQPEELGRGIGKRLYAHLLETLPCQPRALTTWAREDQRRRVRFFEERGFKEAMRGFESRLEVSRCDLSPYTGLETKLRRAGITICTLAELEGDPACERKLYDLHGLLEQDVPTHKPFTRPTFEEFVARSLHSQQRIKEAYFVALNGEEYIGLSELSRSDADPHLHTGLTGVARAYRRQGIALALKLRGIAFAKAYGYPELRTWNAAQNRAMLGINERLGFVKRPASIDYVKITSS